MKFTHLHTHTHYSLLDGLSKIDEFVKHAKELGMDSLAITDHGNLYGVIEFYKKARKAGIKPIIGVEVYIAGKGMKNKRSNIDDERYHLVLLAKNQTGYKNLMKLVTASHLEGFYYKPRIDKEILKKNSEGLMGLSACLNGEIPRALLSNNSKKARALADEYQDIFGKGNFYLEIQCHPNLEDQNYVNERIIKLHRETLIPIVATQDSHYLKKEDAQAHDILLAVQTNNKIDEKERLTMKGDDFSLVSPEDAFNKFSKIKTLKKEELNSLFENTQVIADKCNLEIKLGEIQLPYFPLPKGFKTPEEYLKHLSYKGLETRYGDAKNPEILKRLGYELSVIEKTDFASYFLIVQDLVNWAKQNGIIVGPGRGSAAGSLVSYLLNITNIDPLKYNLIFERFLNPARISMPDIDLDFDDTRRYEVLDYIAEKYGDERVAQIITFGTMASRGAIRDAGRALGYSYNFCDRIAKMIPFNKSLSVALEKVSDLKEAYDSDAQTKTLIDSAKKLEGVARHVSTHACGIVISKDKLINYSPLQRASQDDQSAITQYEMHAIEDLGLLKMDLLGLSNLTIIDDTINQVEKKYGTRINIDEIPINDKKTFKLFREAKTTGVFQLESGGMKRYLKQLKPTELEDIIAMVSLYRPGPMELIPEYIDRKHGRKKIDYLHPKLEPVLKNTYGIMIYQEQLMAAAQSLAGLTLAEADILRKAVGKKIRKLLQEQKGKLIQGSIKNGVSQKTAEKFWELIQPFDRYGFNRSHGACYAMIAYQTAYLKAHHPTEFMSALMNSASGDVERIAFLIGESKEMDINVLAPDINESVEDFTVISTESDKLALTIRFGLGAIKNVGLNVIEVIIKEREENGHYKSIEDFISRVQSKDLNKKSLESLIKCGALDKFGERNLFLTNSEQLLQYAKEGQKYATTGQKNLFGLMDVKEIPPIRLTQAEPAPKQEKLAWEKELLGLFVTDHPLKDHQSKLKLEHGTTEIKDAVNSTNGKIKIGGLITKIHRITTKNGKPMIFTWLEDLSSKIEVVVFPTILEKNPAAWQENNIVVVKGKLNDRDGVSKLICDEVVPITT